jgi:hypothetical protein
MTSSRETARAAGGVRGRSVLARLLLVVAVVGLVFAPRSSPGTVAEQRQRLPPPASCEHEVEGYWKAHVYDSAYRDWHVFTLEVHKVEGNETALRGTIRVEAWSGTEQEQEAGPCKNGRLHFTGKMTAEGSIIDGVIHFRGTQFTVDQVLCGHFGSYALDHFSGKIDPATQEFQSVNDDGNRGEQATVFRRIGCFDSGPPPAVSVKPPPLAPTKPHAGGCNCGPGAR